MYLIYKRIWPLMSAKQRWRLLPLIALMLAAGIFELAGVASIVPFLAVLANPQVVTERAELQVLYEWTGATDTFDLLRIMGLIVFIAIIGSIMVKATTLYFITQFVRSMAIDLGVVRLRRYLMQPYEWFLAQHTADLGKSVLEEVQQIVSNTVAPAVRTIANLLILVILAGFLIYLEPVGAIAAGIVFGAGFGIAYDRLRRKLTVAGRERRAASRERFVVTAEAMSGIKDVKMHGLEESYVQRFVEPSRRLARHLSRAVLLSEMPRFVLEALALGGILFFVLYLLWSRPGGLAEFLPVIGAFAFAGLKMMPTIQTLFTDVALMRFGDAGLAALAEDMDGYRHDPSPSSGSGQHPIRMRRVLALKGVSYRYPGAARDVVQDVSFEIHAGTSVGIVGPTGAGKTTVVDILLGLLVPGQGSLLVDGEPITEARRRAWQQGIGYVPQSIYLTASSIAQNIAFGVPVDQIDQGRLRRAARLADIDAFIETLDAGYETEIGENGVRLSGGQRQRIGIARAMYKEPALVVFDEATSALDTLAERTVIEAIKRLEGETTVLMITHRLTTVAHCDTILVFKDGRLTGSGDYATLSEESEVFRGLTAAAEKPSQPADTPA